MILFYIPYNIEENPVLPEAESQHCVKVLRKQAGDVIDLTDGRGNFFQAEITEAHPKHCRFRVLKKLPQPQPWEGRIEIAVAPTKNMDRMEWFAEKATETGINAMHFLRCRYSERKEIKTERIHKILVSAMKQSEKATLPEVSGMIDFARLVSRPFEGEKFIAHCRPEAKEYLAKAHHPGANVLILIGPEGDFSEEEVALAKANGFRAISLGESRLRTETAALSACLHIHIANQLK